MSTDGSGVDRLGLDPDADPEMKTDKAEPQPDQAEGADDQGETRGG